MVVVHSDAADYKAKNEFRVNFSARRHIVLRNIGRLTSNQAIDLMIAATACLHGLILATLNVRDFA